MCGIYGILSLVDGEAVDPDLLAPMAAVTQHRGPDDEGRFLAAGLVIPDVEGYYEDVLELVAPVNVREALGVSEGETIEVEIDLDSDPESGAA